MSRKIILNFKKLRNQIKTIGNDYIKKGIIYKRVFVSDTFCDNNLVDGKRNRKNIQ